MLASSRVCSSSAISVPGPRELEDTEWFKVHVALPGISSRMPYNLKHCDVSIVYLQFGALNAVVNNDCGREIESASTKNALNGAKIRIFEVKTRTEETMREIRRGSTVNSCVRQLAPYVR
jgi:hypothetical protein